MSRSRVPITIKKGSTGGNITEKAEAVMRKVTKGGKMMLARQESSMKWERVTDDNPRGSGTTGTHLAVAERLISVVPTVCSNRQRKHKQT